MSTGLQLLSLRILSHLLEDIKETINYSLKIIFKEIKNILEDEQILWVL